MINSDVELGVGCRGGGDSGRPFHWPRRFCQIRRVCESQVQILSVVMFGYGLDFFMYCKLCLCAAVE